MSIPEMPTPEPQPEVEETIATQKPEGENVSIRERKGFSPYQNALVGKDYMSGVQLEKIDADKENMVLPSCTQEEAKTYFEELPFFDNSQSTEGSEWANTYGTGSYFNHARNAFDGAASDKERLFAQSVASELGKLGAGRVRVSDSGSKKVSGEAALFRIRNMMGMGGLLQIPLWHSGFWVTVKTPSEGAQLDLDYNIATSKLTTGRATTGLAFSNNSVYYYESMFDFFFQHIYECSLNTGGTLTKQDLLDHISVNDLPVIAWAMACVIWPKGFQFSRACSNDPTICTHVTRDVLDLTKLCWTDRTALTKRQIEHMTTRGHMKMSKESIKLYQEEFGSRNSNTIDVDENVTIALHTPNVGDQIASGNRWIQDIQTMVDNSAAITSATGEDDEKRLRSNFVGSMSRATALRQYAGFVKEVQLSDGTVIDDPATVDQFLAEMSGDDKFRAAFFDKISAHINKSVVSIIAVPTYTCPSCGFNQEESRDYEGKQERFTNLVPFDVIRTFFIQLSLKRNRLTRDPL